MESLSAQCYNECCGGGSGNNSGTALDNSTTRSSSCNGANNGRRKMSRWDQSEPNHSNGSLLSTMERFVQTVDDMNETILVPCRLMDLQFDETLAQAPEKVASTNSGVVGAGAAGSKTGGDRILSNLNGVDLYQFYTVLNNIKNDLMWGHKPQQTQQTSIPSNPALSNSSSAASVISTVSSNISSSSNNASLSQVPHGQSTEVVKGHARRPSTVSTTSSTSASDTEFSELNEDSGVEAEHEEECGQTIADAFHHHLSGLQQSLCDLTIAADYVTTRYNTALGGLIP